MTKLTHDDKLMAARRVQAAREIACRYRAHRAVIETLIAAGVEKHEAEQSLCPHKDDQNSSIKTNNINNIN